MLAVQRAANGSEGFYSSKETRPERLFQCPVAWTIDSRAETVLGVWMLLSDSPFVPASCLSCEYAEDAVSAATLVESSRTSPVDHSQSSSASFGNGAWPMIRQSVDLISAILLTRAQSIETSACFKSCF